MVILILYIKRLFLKCFFWIQSQKIVKAIPSHFKKTDIIIIQVLMWLSLKHKCFKTQGSEKVG